jgi:uncharacterized protein YneF (UPF0154 family)
MTIDPRLPIAIIMIIISFTAVANLILCGAIIAFSYSEKMSKKNPENQESTIKESKKP